MKWAYLGLVPYQQALALQLARRNEILEGRGGSALLLLEHPPVITLGRSAGPENILAGQEELQRRGVAVERTTRGGDVTYHGPGQLVAYPIRRVDRAVNAHVQGMARAAIRLLAWHGIEAYWSPERPGVWTSAGKVAAVGVDARGGVAMHGLALNVTLDPADFALILPCGYRAPVASMVRLMGPQCQPPALKELAGQLAGLLAEELGEEPLEEVTPRELGLDQVRVRTP